MITNVALITGGIWHETPYLFLKKNKVNFVLFDDNKNCYLGKKYNLNPIETKKISNKKYNNFFFWSPTNDFGSALADLRNKKNFRLRIKKLYNGKFDKTKIFKNKIKKISKNKKYLLKPKNGSGSRGISFWNYKKFDKQKYFIEEYIDGIELSIEVISFVGKHNILNISLRLLDDYKSAIAIIPILKLKNKKKVLNQITKKLNQVGIVNGISHLECKINKKDELFFFDINLRAGGFGVTDLMLNCMYKINLYEYDFKILINQVKFLSLKLIEKKIFFLVYNNYQNNHFKKKLNEIDSTFKYKKLKFNKKNFNDHENDANRTELLFGHCKDFYQLKKIFFKLLRKKKFDLFYKQYKKLSC